MNVTAEQFVDVKPFAIEIRNQRRMILAGRLQKDIDEERAARKLLHEQVAGGLAGCDLLAARDVFDESRRVSGIELPQPKRVEKFKIGFGVMRGCENLTTQPREHKRETAASEHLQDFFSENYHAIQILSELRSVDHYEG